MAGERYLERTLSAVLRRAARHFAAVVLTGPRQSGKTTFVRRMLAGSHGYCSLDDPGLADLARQDPQLLLTRFPPPVVLDEVQHAPAILSHVKADIDEHRAERGRWILTGSQVFPLMAGVTESLAGRAAILSLQSLSLREASGFPGGSADGPARLASARRATRGGGFAAVDASARALLRGGYPETVVSRGLDVALWHASYLQTYLERDVRSLRAVASLGDFQRFLRAVAARTGGLVNLEELGRDLGLTANTMKAWLRVLEASGQVTMVRPYFASLGKRLVKRPKIYFNDTGTLAHLLGLSQPDQALHGMAAGPLFEAAVFGQLLRLFIHRGRQERISFWRTAAGHEVDFVVEDGPRLIPVEAKLTATPSARDADGIERFRQLFPDRAGRGVVVCLCRERIPLTRAVDAVPLGAF